MNGQKSHQNQQIEKHPLTSRFLQLCVCVGGEGGHHGHDRMVVGFTTTCEISVHHH